ncbi:MAG: SpoIIE family protein phosphatase [Planctomycetes bacterium]|nr:SpoIIE family protein phosphatase [Planctomycetota bacterium]
MGALRYVDDADRVRTKTLDSARFVIGRTPACQISFDSDMISREHACIELDADGRFRLCDLGSRNKTHVNGELITETVLTPGDLIRVGDRVLEFIEDTVSPDAGGTEFLTPDGADPPDAEWVKIKNPVSLTLKQLEQLAQIGSNQPLTARAEDITAMALSNIVLDLQAERGLIALRGESKAELRPLAQRGLKRPSGASLTPVSQSFVLAPILRQVAGRYPQTVKQLNAKLGFAVTAAVAPLTYRGEIVGIVYVDRPNTKRPFTGAALQYLTAAGAQIGSLLGDAARRLSHDATREGAAWMSTIRRVQRAVSPEIASSDAFEVASKHYPGRMRCGDVATVIHVDEQRCALGIVDGGGHGMTGIVQASVLQSSMRTALAISDDVLADPAVLFNTLNHQLASSGARQVLPCVFVGIDMSAGKLTYINAGGMPPLLMVAAGRLVTLDQTSLVLGVDRDYAYETTRVDLPETFRLVCFTDGLTEATSAGGDVLGHQRVHDTLLEREAFGSAEDILARLDNTWSTHLAGSQADDDALVVVLGRGRVSS